MPEKEDFPAKDVIKEIVTSLRLFGRQHILVLPLKSGIDGTCSAPAPEIKKLAQTGKLNGEILSAYRNRSTGRPAPRAPSR